MKASEIVTWARSLANLSTSKVIGYDDEDKSLNAIWRDLHARILESNDDYITKTVVIPITPAMSVGTFEYLAPLPEDFYQLRTVSYQEGITGNWIPMNKFALSSRDDVTSFPGYRLDNTNLWLRGQSIANVRVKYYPPPVAVTHPETDLQFATAVTPNNFSLITSPVYASWKNTGVYIYNAQNIVEGAIDSGTTGTPVTLLAVGVNVSNLVYYKGYLYYLQAGKIRRAPTDLVTAPLVPADVIASGTVTSFSVFANTLYYTDGGTMKTAALDGSGVVAGGAIAATWQALAGGTLFYVLAGALKSVTPATTLIASGVSACVSDGTSLYILDTQGQLRKLVVAGALIASDTVLRTDVFAIGPWYANRIPVLTNEGQKMLAISSYVDTDITYPANVVLQIMSYQLAVDFKTKVGEDFSKLLERLGHPKSGSLGPATGLWSLLESTIKRDEYKPERVNNSRRSIGYW